MSNLHKISNLYKSSSAEPGPNLDPLLPDRLKPFLILLHQPFGLPVCLCCQSAILPKSLMDHLRKQHQLPVELRSTVRSLVSTLPSFDFSDVPNQPDGSPPLDELRLVDAFQCKHCHFIRRDLSDVRKHINKEHSISAAGNYGQIQAQSWFAGRRAVYWRVCSPPTSEVDSDIPACVWGFFGTGFGDKTPRSWPPRGESGTAGL